jgi:hypothetical protein
MNNLLPASMTRKNTLLVEFMDEVRSFATLEDDRQVPIDGMKMYNIIDLEKQSYLAQFCPVLDRIDLSNVSKDAFADIQYIICTSAPTVENNTNHWVVLEVAGAMGEGAEFVLGFNKPIHVVDDNLTEFIDVLAPPNWLKNVMVLCAPNQKIH